MQATFRQQGNSVDYTPGSAVAAGDVVVQGSLVGVATAAIAALALGSLIVRGIIDIVQAAVTITAGQPAYWDADGDPVGGTQGTGAATNVATGNTFMGFFTAASADTSETAPVCLLSTDATSLTTHTINELADVGAVAYTAGKILVADGNSYEEVAVSGDAALASTGALTLANAAKPLSFAIADPGDGEAIPVTASGHVDIVSGAGGETNTLAVPAFAGQVLAITLKTDGGGDRVITVADPHIDGTNNTITLNDAGDTVLLLGVSIGATFGWRLVVNVGATLSHV